MRKVQDRYISMMKSWLSQTAEIFAQNDHSGILLLQNTINEASQEVEIPDEVPLESLVFTPSEAALKMADERRTGSISYEVC